MLILIALCPWLLRDDAGDGWLWRWLVFGGLVLVIVVAYAVMASGSGGRQQPTARSRSARSASGSGGTPWPAQKPDLDLAPLRAEVPPTSGQDSARGTAEAETTTAAESRADTTIGAAPEPQAEPVDDSQPHTSAVPLFDSTTSTGSTSAIASTGSFVAAAATADAELIEKYKREAEATQVALLSLGRKVQASAHRIQQEAARAISKHASDPEVLETGLRLDHAAAQQARLAQSLATLCGMQPGQQWFEPLPVSDIAWAAAGRITAYKRVQVDGDPSLAVVGPVAEPLIHLIAELLANATQSSPPGTSVYVTLREVRRGASIEIDDCGVGMDEARMERAREVAAGRQTVTLADLGEIPQTGLAVVGTYARRHGFRVDLTESVHGGIRAAVIVPKTLTVSLPKESSFAFDQEQTKPAPPPAARTNPVVRTSPVPKAPEPAVPEPVTPEPAAPEPADGPKPPEVPSPSTPAPETTAPGIPKRRSRRDEVTEPVAEPEVSTTTEGLPKRQSRRDDPIAPPPRDPKTTPAKNPGQRPSAEQAGAWMGSYLGATRRSPKREPDAPPASPPNTGEADE